jgi:hypothetical protein
LGALGSIVTFIGTTSIIPFLPDAWAREAGGFPIMTLPLGFLMKDVLFLAASFYLLKQDLTRAALEIARGWVGQFDAAIGEKVTARREELEAEMSKLSGYAGDGRRGYGPDPQYLTKRGVQISAIWSMVLRVTGQFN